MATHRLRLVWVHFEEQEKSASSSEEFNLIDRTAVTSTPLNSGCTANVFRFNYSHSL